MSTDSVMDIKGMWEIKKDVITDVTRKEAKWLNSVTIYLLSTH